MRIAIQSDNSGLIRIAHGDDGSVSTMAIRWEDVLNVSAFKRDLFAHDLVCLAISGAAYGIEVDEQMDGWEELIKALPVHLNGTPTVTDWWARVAHPAFATNGISLFTKRRSGP